MPQRAKRSPPRRKLKGGIARRPRNKSFSVEIRIKSWKQKLWIGKLKTRADAQYAEDAALYYVGKQPRHFEDAVVRYPSLKCMGTEIGIPEELSNQEMFTRYIKKFAKGDDFLSHRKDFIRQVQNVIKRDDFRSLTVIDDDDSHREQGVPPLEYDELTAQALQTSSHQYSSGAPATVVPTHAAGLDVVSDSDAFQAYVPSFEFSMDDSDNVLRNAEQSLGLIHDSPNDCPTKDEKELRRWKETVDSLNNSRGIGAFSADFVFNAW